MPSMIQASVPVPWAPRTLTGSTDASQATPATPKPSFARAAAMLATAVPWPLSSAGSGVAVDDIHSGEQL